MCRDHSPTASGNADSAHDAKVQHHEPFPWDEGVFDAHCHPTDTMGSITQIPAMKASCLTIMATRSQDQHLVDEVAESLGIRSRDSLNAAVNEMKLVPAFGWHPWFSYQIYDDSASEPTYKPMGSSDEDVRAAKKTHYQAVLAPKPEDPEFLDSLPVPTSLSSFIAATREYLSKHPLALVGEVGLDKAFRLPRQWDPDAAASRDDTLTPGGREGRKLSLQRVSMPHQQAVLRAQLALAGVAGRAVSLHGVQAHGVLLETVASCWKGYELPQVSRREKRLAAQGAEDDDEEDEQSVGAKPYPPRLCLHSFSGAVELLRQWLHPAIPAKIFVSFSVVINLSADSGKLEDVIKAVPENRILIESDLHTAGDDMDSYLEEMYRKVCEVRGWDLREGVAKIRRNYEEFILG